MSYFKTGQGIRLFYTHLKNEGKPTLVFLHGLGCDSAYWGQYVAFFRNEYSLVLVDLRGHGKSDKPKNKENYELEEFCGDITQLLSALKLKQYFLIGHSFGGVIVGEIAKNNLPRLKGVVLVSTPTGFKDIKKTFLLEVALAALFPQNFYRALQKKRHFSQERNKIMFCIKCLARNHVGAALHILSNSKKYRRFPRLRIPHLAIICERDEIIKNNIKTLKGDEVKIINGRHLAFLTKYQEICSLIQTFIDQDGTHKAQFSLRP